MKSDRISQGPSQRLRRSNSVTSISARLGNRRLFANNNQIQNNNPRRRLNRTVNNNNNSRQNTPRSNSRARSNSRSRVPNARSNSRTRLTRSNSQSNLKRVNSRNNLNQVNTPRRPLNKNNFRNGLTKPSVNSRLGLNRTANPIIVGNRTRRAVGNTGIRGRVVRRGAANNNTGAAVRGRIGRPRTRFVLFKLRFFLFILKNYDFAEEVQLQLLLEEDPNQEIAILIRIPEVQMVK